MSWLASHEYLIISCSLGGVSRYIKMIFTNYIEDFENLKMIYHFFFIAGHPWMRLPPVTPIQIVISRQIKKFLTGDAEALVS